MENSPEDETNADVWQVPWTNQEGRIKINNGYRELIFILNIQNL